jgi:hypothetical protein
MGRVYAIHEMQFDDKARRILKLPSVDDMKIQRGRREVEKPGLG